MVGEELLLTSSNFSGLVSPMPTEPPVTLIPDCAVIIPTESTLATSS